MTKLQKTNQDLLKLIYDAASDSRCWVHVLEQLRQYLNSAAVALLDYNFATRHGKILHDSGGNPDYARRYAEHYAPLNVWMQPGEWYTPGQASLGEQICPAEKLLKTPFYNEWLKPQDFFHRVCLVLERTGEQIYYFAATRPQRQGTFESREIQLLQSLATPLQQATQRNRHLWRLAIVLDVLEHLPFVVAAVDKHGRALFMNRAAEDFLGERDGIYFNGERLCVSRAYAAQFNELVTSAAIQSTGKQSLQGGSLIIQRGQSLPPLWVIVSPLQRKLRKVIGQEDEVALVFVSIPERLGKLPEKMLLMYGLTPAEHRLALLILEGYRLEEAAEKLHITQNTARTHMKRIYAKTGTERQADLIRLMLKGPYGSVLLN